MYVGANIVAQTNRNNALHCQDSRHFWFRWVSTGLVHFGSGSMVSRGNSTYIEYNDPTPIRPITHAGFESTVGETTDLNARFHIFKNMGIASVSFFASDVFTFDHVWESVERSRFITFGVTACSDAHVILSNTARLFGGEYELIIGGWQNTRSVIMIRNSRESAVAATPNYLSCTEQRFFWFTWQYGNIAVGQGQIVGLNRFLSYQPLQMYPVNAVGYSCGWGYNGTWYRPMAAALLPTERPATPIPTPTPTIPAGINSGTPPETTAGVVLGVLAAIMVVGILVIYFNSRGKGSTPNAAAGSTAAGDFPSTSEEKAASSSAGGAASFDNVGFGKTGESDD